MGLVNEVIPHEELHGRVQAIAESVIEIDPIADKKPFQDAVKPVWDKYGAKYTDMIKQIQAVS